MKFESFLKLEEYISEKEKKDFVQFLIVNSRTIEAARKKGVKRHIKACLKYYEICYRCIHSGVRKSQSTGVRPNHSTFRKECPFLLRLKASLDGQTLDVTTFVDEHNHSQNEETFRLLPKQRRLDGPTREMAKHLLSLRVNKKLLQSELFSSKSKRVTLRDLHNLNQKDDEDNLETALNYLTNKEDAIVEIVTDEENVFKGLFYQDAEMKRLFQSYPEMLFVDAIYKVSNLRIPLYIFAIEDGNGETEIVAFFLAASEDSYTIEKMINIFKTNNPAWTNTSTVMTDKDFEERAAFKKEFPEAHLLICLFHTLRTFKREINIEKMGISPGQKIICLELAQKIVYAKSVEEYMSTFKEIQDSKISSFIEYFKKNWHPIKEQWVPGLQQVLTLGNRTNNRLESINSKVMQVVERHSRLPDLFKNLDFLLVSLRTERDQRTARLELKVPLNVVFSHKEQENYLHCLTPHAYGLMNEKFKMMKKVKLLEYEEPNQENFKVKSSCGILTVSADKCTCPFNTNVKLPCHHILFVRDLKELNLFSEQMIPERWKKSYYLKNSRLNTTPNPTDSYLTTSVVPQKKVLSQHDKYRLVSTKFKDIASLASEAPSRIFPQRLQILDTLIRLWGDNKEVFVGEIITTADTPDITCPVEEEISSQNDVRSVKEDILTKDHISCNEEGNSTQETVSSVYEKESSGPSKQVVEELWNAALVDHDYFKTTQQSKLPTMPTKFKKRGRPKGSDSTVIGIPRKKKTMYRILPFEKKTSQQRELQMLKWFVRPERAVLAQNGSLLQEMDIEVNPNKVTSGCLDSNVDMYSIRKYFDADGWKSIEHLIHVKQKNPFLMCPLCEKESSTNSVCCKSCLNWFHMTCCGLGAVRPKVKQWFCRPCHDSYLH